MSLISQNLFITTNARQIVALSSHDAKVNWVGDLISIKDRASKRPKPTLFQDPFLAKTANGFSINVVASNGELYQFDSNESGEFSKEPNVIAIYKNILYQWLSCCTGELRLITNSHINF
jgi:hypothetical protein